MIYPYVHEYAACLMSKAYIHFNDMLGIITEGIQKNTDWFIQNYNNARK